MMIKLTINGTVVEMEEAEARRVWSELDSLFCRHSEPPVYIPCNPWVYQPIITHPAKPLPDWIYPQITCQS